MNIYLNWYIHKNVQNESMLASNAKLKEGKDQIYRIFK